MRPSAPIRLVFCITELDPGGAERALTQLVLNLNRNDWEPHIICLGPRGHLADVLNSADVPVLCLNASGALSLPRVLFRLTREIRRLRPAIVQTFLFHANILGRIAARFAGVKLIVSGLRVAERRSPWYGRIDRWTNRLVVTNVCVSRGVADFSARVVGLDPAKLVVIPNAVEIEKFVQARPADLTQFGIPAGSRMLIAIGRLERQKGFDVLLEAIALLKPVPDDVYFLIVGEGPDYDKLRKMAERSGVAGNMRWVNRRSDVPDLLAASTALILSSRWEGMPNVVLEAMASGRPVIATRVEGIAELVLDGDTGLVVSPEQPAELARAIRDLLARANFWVSAGIAAQQIVEKEFTPQAIAAAYETLYRQLLGSPADSD